MGIFSKLTNLANGAKKMEKRDLMQACIAGAVLVAFADGELEDSEVKALHEIVESQPTLANFGPELAKTIDQYIGVMKASKYLGKVKLMREIEDIKSTPDEIEEVFAIMLTIAEADGQIEDAEMKLITEIGKKLGVSLQKFGLAA